MGLSPEQASQARENDMDEQSPGGSPAANWYPDPCGRHEFRYWDGAAWTQHVSDSGQPSVDPVDASSPSEATGQPSQDVDVAGAETVLLTLPKTTDVTWGGFANMHLTNRRLIVEPVLGTGAVMGAVAAGGIVGLKIASNRAEKRFREENREVRTCDEILRSSNKAYAIEYGDISEMVLKRKALPVGHSRCKIRSGQKNVTLAFKREMFDEASAVLAEVLSGRVTIR
jgi:hypothetical protein